MPSWLNFETIRLAMRSRCDMAAARLLLIHWAAHCPRGELRAEPSRERLMALTLLSSRTVDRAFAELVKSGELRLIEAGGGRARRNVYELNPEALGGVEEPRQVGAVSDEKPCHSGKVSDDEPRQLDELYAGNPATLSAITRQSGGPLKEKSFEKKRARETAAVALSSPASPGVSTKPSKTKPGDSLAVATWKQHTGIKRPAPAVVALIDAAVTDLETERWARVLKLWIAKGHKPGNVDGQLDWFAGVDERVPRELRIRRDNSTGTPTPAPRVRTDDPDAPRDEAIAPPGVAPTLWHMAHAVATLVERRHPTLDGVGSQRWALAAVAWVRAQEPGAKATRHVEALRNVISKFHSREGSQRQAHAFAVLDAIASGAAGKGVARVA